MLILQGDELREHMLRTFFGSKELDKINANTDAGEQLRATDENRSGQASSGQFGDDETLRRRQAIQCKLNEVGASG
jgi:hypothetical protein